MDAFRHLLRQLLEASPAHAVFFYTDWQHGPTRKFRGGILTESTFQHLHDTHQIRLNACYTIQADPVT